MPMRMTLHFNANAMFFIPALSTDGNLLLFLLSLLLIFFLSNKLTPNSSHSFLIKFMLLNPLVWLTK